MKLCKIMISVTLVLIMLFGGILPVFAVLPGDVDRDGSVTAADARLILRASVGLETIANRWLADLDGDNAVTAADARLALRMSVGLEKLLPEKQNGEPVRVTLDSETCLLYESEEISVEFPDTVFDGKKTLTLQRIEELPTLYPDDTKAVIYDIELDGISELNGISKITLPYEEPYFGRDLAAAYYNETTGEWEPVNYDYDGERVTIFTDHLSTFGVFTVEKEHTKDAYIRGYSLPRFDARYDFEYNTELLRRTSETGTALTAMGDTMAEMYADASGFGMDMGYNTITAFGFENALLEKYGTLLSDLGTCFSLYQIARYHYDGNDARVAGNSIKTLGQFWIGRAASACKNATLTASLAATAIIDYSINKFGEEAVSGRKDIFSDAFDLYYGEPANKRTAADWYKALWPVFKETDMTPEQMQQKVGAIIDGYCNKFWEDESVVADYITKSREKFGWSYAGGLNDGIKKELSDSLKATLYSGVLRSVFLHIGEKLEQRNYELFIKKLDEFAQLVSGYITLSFYDSGAKGTSEYAGGNVKFAAMPSYGMQDPGSWQCVLDGSGRGSIKFTLLSYIMNGFSPIITVKTENGSRSVQFKLKTPETKIDLKGAKDLSQTWVRTGERVIQPPDTNTGVYKDTYTASIGSHAHVPAYIYDTPNQSCLFRASCSEPPKTIKAGEKVRLDVTLNIYQSNVTDYHFRETAAVCWERPDVGLHGAVYNRKFEPVDGGNNCQVWAIGDWGSDPVRITSATVEYEFPAGGADKVMSVNFNACGCRTQWLYTWVE